MKNFVRAVFLTLAPVLLALNFACAPGGNRGGDPASGAKGPVIQGTVSGGGGNGCEGKPFEAYSRKISSLDEYRIYLRPLLRRMSEQGSDPLVTYLLWAAEEKAWYFIPCEFQKLSTEQIGVAVESDQLARHGAHGIYIHAIEETPEIRREREKLGLPPLKTYYQKKPKEKAALLLHEMVMGARLLMKKPAKEQCTSLAKKDALLCADPEVMAIAEARDVDVSQQDIMDGADHETIRAMTTFLSEKGADLSRVNVQAVRERLGFFFPWSRAASNVDYGTFTQAIARSRQLEDRYRVVGAVPHVYFKDVPMTCSIGQQIWNGETRSYLTVDFVSNIPAESALPKHLGWKQTSTQCASRADRIHFPFKYNPVSHVTEQVPCSDGKLLGTYDYRYNVTLSKDNFAVRGVLRDGVVYDEVSMTLIDSSGTGPITLKGVNINAGIFKILMTREEAPRIHLFRIEPKQLLENPLKKVGAPAELLDIPGLVPLECARAVAG